MKALLCSIGSRGDIEPFLALGHILRKQNIEIICAFPEQFREMTEQEGFSFHGFTKDFIEVLMHSTEGNLISGGEGTYFQRLKSVWSLIKKSIHINQSMISDQRNLIIEHQFDYICYHPKCLYPAIWGIKFPKRCVVISPLPCVMHTIYTHSVIGLKGGGNYGPFLNHLSFGLSNWVRAIAFYFSTKKYHSDITGTWITPGKIKRSFLQKQKTVYSISPTLFPRPKHWKSNINISGYLERNKSQHWQPDKMLDKFVGRYDKLLFVSFGSISNPNPEQKTAAILETLIKYNIPSIVSTAWGGLVEPANYPEHILFVKQVPYDWLFPKLYAVVHHGGAGTTHTALKYGCASLIIPHFIDQFFWNQRVADLGAGPKGISIKALTAENFETRCLDLWKNEAYKSQAENIATQMQGELNEKDLLHFITLNHLS